MSNLTSDLDNVWRDVCKVFSLNEVSSCHQAAHGSLSATKVKQWGLEKALLTLSDNLGELVVAGLRKLT